MHAAAYPTLEPKERVQGPRISYCAAQPALRVRLSLRESRMKFVDPHQALQEIRGMGHPSFRGANYGTQPLKRFHNYCGLIKIAMCGFPWEKTT
jgi:hypothetical protein